MDIIIEGWIIKPAFFEVIKNDEILTTDNYSKLIYISVFKLKKNDYETLEFLNNIAHSNYVNSVNYKDYNIDSSNSYQSTIIKLDNYKFLYELRKNRF